MAEVEVYNSEFTAEDFEKAIRAVPNIGENGNWFIGDEDTGIYASGINVSGAKEGQLVQIAAVDANGKPTAWTPTDGIAGDPPMLIDWTAEEPFSFVTFTTDDNGVALKCANRFYFEAVLVPAVSDSKVFFVNTCSNTQGTGPICPSNMTGWTTATIRVTGSFEKIMTDRYRSITVVQTPMSDGRWTQVEAHGNGSQHGRVSISEFASNTWKECNNTVTSLQIGVYVEGAIAAGSTIKVWGD